MFVTSRSDWYSLYWSGAEHYRYCSCQVGQCTNVTVGQHFKQFYCTQLKNGQLNEMSATVSDM